MLTSAVSILMVPFSSTVTGVLSARGLFEVRGGPLSASFPGSCGERVSYCGDDGGCALRPDCAVVDELITQTNPATKKITAKQRASKLLFIYLLENPRERAWPGMTRVAPRPAAPIALGR